MRKPQRGACPPMTQKLRPSETLCENREVYRGFVFQRVARAESLCEIQGVCRGAQLLQRDSERLNSLQSVSEGYGVQRVAKTESLCGPSGPSVPETAHIDPRRPRRASGPPTRNPPTVAHLPRRQGVPFKMSSKVADQSVHLQQRWQPPAGNAASRPAPGRPIRTRVLAQREPIYEPT